MIHTIDHQHPFYSVIEHLTRMNTNWMLEFSKYIQLEKGRTERRIFLRRQLANVTNDWLNHILSSLEQNEELAFHSRLYCHGQEFHLPLADFLVRMNPEDAKDLVCKKCNFERNLLELYDSGRSLHGYYFKLMLRDEWLKYLGDLLLINNTVEYIDSRWVGHSLRNGFSSLRWSCNTPRHKSMPTLAFVKTKDRN